MVGPGHVALLINGRYELYAKNSGGAPLAGQAASLNGFWSALVGVPGREGNAFDPRIAYDPLARRWYALSVDGGQSTNSGFLLAVSVSDDPTEG